MWRMSFAFPLLVNLMLVSGYVNHAVRRKLSFASIVQKESLRLQTGRDVKEIR